MAAVLPPVDVQRRDQLAEVTMRHHRLAHSAPSIAIPMRYGKKLIDIRIGLDYELDRLAEAREKSTKGLLGMFRRMNRAFAEGDVKEFTEDLLATETQIATTGLAAIALDLDTSPSTRSEALRQYRDVAGGRTSTPMTERDAALLMKKLEADRKQNDQWEDCTLVSRKFIMDELAPSLAPMSEALTNDAIYRIAETLRQELKKAENLIEFVSPGVHPDQSVVALKDAKRTLEKQLVDDYEPALAALRDGEPVPDTDRAAWAAFVVLLDRDRTPGENGELERPSPVVIRSARQLFAETSLNAVTDKLESLPQRTGAELDHRPDLS
jgi:transposase-like protein